MKASAASALVLGSLPGPEKPGYPPSPFCCPRSHMAALAASAPAAPTGAIVATTSATPTTIPTHAPNRRTIIAFPSHTQYSALSTQKTPRLSLREWAGACHGERAIVRLLSHEG